LYNEELNFSRGESNRENRGKLNTRKDYLDLQMKNILLYNSSDIDISLLLIIII